MTITAPFHALRTRKPSPPQPIPGRLLAVIDHIEDSSGARDTLTLPDGTTTPVRDWRWTTIVIPDGNQADWPRHTHVAIWTSTRRHFSWERVSVTVETRDTHHTRYTIKAQP